MSEYVNCQLIQYYTNGMRRQIKVGVQKEIVVSIPNLKKVKRCVQVDFVKKFQNMWGELNLNIFSNGLLHKVRLYPYNNTLDVENLIFNIKYKKINIYLCYLTLKIID